MLTRAAAVTPLAADTRTHGVLTRAQLRSAGVTPAQIDARLAAARWQRVGRAIVMHNAQLDRRQRWAVAVINCGPRAALAALSATEHLGLTGWEREEIHVLAPAGVPCPRGLDLPIILHRTAHTVPAQVVDGIRCQPIAEALVLGASGFRQPRPACGLLAAGVQQRLTTAERLQLVVVQSTRIRHRAALLAAVEDIRMGAQALSEIDFVRLCRRYGLPAPRQQSIRREPNGARRYLDAEWTRSDGRRVVAEVDGAVHLAAPRWFADQLRQNEIALTGSLILRFPSVVVRTDEALVARQLRRALLIGS